MFKSMLPVVLWKMQVDYIEHKTVTQVCLILKTEFLNRKHLWNHIPDYVLPSRPYHRRRQTFHVLHHSRERVQRSQLLPPLHPRTVAETAKPPKVARRWSVISQHTIYLVIEDAYYYNHIAYTVCPDYLQQSHGDLFICKSEGMCVHIWCLITGLLKKVWKWNVHISRICFEKIVSHTNIVYVSQYMNIKQSLNI